MTSTGDTTAVREGHVTSRDGTRIGVLSLGHGPGLVLVQGAMATAAQYRELAQVRWPRTSPSTPPTVVAAVGVHGPTSPPTTSPATSRTSTRSSPRPARPTCSASAPVPSSLSKQPGHFDPAHRRRGLRTTPLRRRPLRARRRPAARRRDRARPTSDAALVTALQTSGTAPAALRGLPRGRSRGCSPAASWLLNARHPGQEFPLRDLLPGIRYDFHVVGDMDGKRDTLAALHKPLLLLSGTKSPTFLQQATRGPRRRDPPRSHHVELDGLSHSGPWNTRRGGRPDIVAEALRHFFATRR